jgi:cytochrome c553
MDETLFYICGAVVVASGLVVVALAATNDRFPGRFMVPLIGWFAVFGIAAVVFAIANGDSEDVKPEEISYTTHGAPPEEPGEEDETAGGESMEGESTEEEAQGTEDELEQEGLGGEELEGEAEGAATGGGGDAMLGAEVFTENCSTCHGADGAGGNGGPDLNTMPLAQSEVGAIQQVTNGGGGMPAFGGTLSEEEIENVAAYVAQEITHGE